MNVVFKFLSVFIKNFPGTDFPLKFLSSLRFHDFPFVESKYWWLALYIRIGPYHVPNIPLPSCLLHIRFYCIVAVYDRFASNVGHHESSKHKQDLWMRARQKKKHTLECFICNKVWFMFENKTENIGNNVHSYNLYNIVGMIQAMGLERWPTVCGRKQATTTKSNNATEQCTNPRNLFNHINWCLNNWAKSRVTRELETNNVCETFIFCSELNDDACVRADVPLTIVLRMNRWNRWKHTK